MFSWRKKKAATDPVAGETLQRDPFTISVPADWMLTIGQDGPTTYTWGGTAEAPTDAIQIVVDKRRDGAARPAREAVIELGKRCVQAVETQFSGMTAIVMDPHAELAGCPAFAATVSKADGGGRYCRMWTILNEDRYAFITYFNLIGQARLSSDEQETVIHSFAWR